MHVLCVCAFAGEGFSPVAQWAWYTLFLNVPASAAEMLERVEFFFQYIKKKKKKKKHNQTVAKLCWEADKKNKTWRGKLS